MKFAALLTFLLVVCQPSRAAAASDGSVGYTSTGTLTISLEIPPKMDRHEVRAMDGIGDGGSKICFESNTDGDDFELHALNGDGTRSEIPVASVKSALGKRLLCGDRENFLSRETAYGPSVAVLWQPMS